MQDQLAFYASMSWGAYAPGMKHSFSLAGTRWNSRKPLATEVAENYPAWILLCQGRRSATHVKKKDRTTWEKHYKFLMRPDVYLKFHMYADVLDIFQSGSEASQRGNAAENAAVDVTEKLHVLQEQLRGYALAKATPQQLKDEPEGGSGSQANSIIQRCFIEGIIASKRFALQRGLHRIGFHQRDAELSTLSVPMSSEGDAESVRLGFDRDHFKNAYKWTTLFVQGLFKSFERRFSELSVWKALKALVDPTLWRSEIIPKVHHEAIAKHLHTSEEAVQQTLQELEEEWVVVRPLVHARMKSILTLGPLTSIQFRRQALLPGLASRPKPQHGMLTRMLVIGVMTVGNTAQLERDVKSIREVFDRRTRKLDPLKVGMQCRFALNFKHREISQHIDAAARRWHREHHEVDTQKRRVRSDKDGKHKKRRKCLPSHLTSGDVETLQLGLDAAREAIVDDDSSENGSGEDEVPENSLNGVIFAVADV